jgi:threonine synthase
MRLLGMHKDRPLWVRYDLDAVKRAVTPKDLRDRPSSLWRYRELLPLPFDQEPVTLGEGFSPLSRPVIGTRRRRRPHSAPAARR